MLLFAKPCFPPTLIENRELRQDRCVAVRTASYSTVLSQRSLSVDLFLRRGCLQQPCRRLRRRSLPNLEHQRIRPISRRSQPTTAAQLRRCLRSRRPARRHSRIYRVIISDTIRAFLIPRVLRQDRWIVRRLRRGMRGGNIIV